MNDLALAHNTDLATTGPQAELVMPPHVAAVVPFKDHEKYGQLALEQQARVSFLLKLFGEMTTSPEGLVACSDRLEKLYPGHGFSGSNLRTLYYAFRKRGWRALAKIYKGPEKLPADFVQEVRRRIEKNQNSARAAFQEMKDLWAQGEAIPGYGTWREYHAVTKPELDVPERWPFGFYPGGWSESNLYTKQSSKAERSLMRRGYAAAKRYLPGVMRDLSGLRPLELIVIDDFECDQLVRAWNPETKRWQIARVSGLLAIDAATRRKLALGLKPRFKDEEGRQIAITRADVQGLLHSVFSTHGLPADYGCTILCENAAAAITGDFELALELLLGVQVARTGLIGDKTLRNGFVQHGGKPWEKGWIESLFHLMHNTAGALPGQKGASYQLKPADLEAKVLYSEKLLNTEGLPAEAVAQLRVPFITIEEFLLAYERIFTRMESRTDHKCQGFLEVFEYRVPGVAGLLPESALATFEPEQVLACEPVPRNESLIERWERLVPGVRRVKVADYVLACLLLTPKKVTLRNHRLAFAHASQGFTFADADSPVMRLDEGTDLLGYFDAGRPGVLHVTDLKGRYIGAVRRRGAVDIRDQAALSAEQGECARISNMIHSLVRARHAAEDAQLGADASHNVAILREHNLLPAETHPSALRAPQPSGDNSTLCTTPAGPVQQRAKPASQPVGISARLARATAPARGDAPATLAHGIAAEVGITERAAALERQTRADAARLSEADIAAATGGVPAERAPEFSDEEISDILKTD